MAALSSAELAALRAGSPANTGSAAKDTHEAVQTRQAAAGAAHNELENQFVAPKATSELKSQSQQHQSFAYDQEAKMRKDFLSNKLVDQYLLTLPNIASALQTRDTEDSDLIMLAAKIQDPTGSVREGDEQRFATVAPALKAVSQAMGRDLLMTNGVFSPETRQVIRNFIIRRANNYRKGYMQQRDVQANSINDFNKRGEDQLNPLNVIGADPAAAYQPVFEAYDKEYGGPGHTRATPPELMKNPPKDAEPLVAPNPDKENIDILQPVPAGREVGGRPLAGWRFSPEGETALTNYVRSPQATPEGYARLLTDQAVTEGHVQPEQSDAYYKANVTGATDFFKKFKTPEARANIAPGVDYSDIDKAAQKDAGIGTVLKTAAENIPESAAQFVHGNVEMATHPVETAKTLGGLAADLTPLGNGQTLKAATEALASRYGGRAEVKNTFMTDPLGMSSDLSLPISGAGGVMRLGRTALPALTDLGTGLGKIGGYLDPVSGTRKFLGKAGDTLSLDAVKTAPTDLAGMPSGLGGPALREAGAAGFQRGREGVNDASTAFTTNMRHPDENAGAAVALSRKAVDNMRKQASADYRSQIASLGENPQPLSLDGVRDRLKAVQPEDYADWADAPPSERPASHLAWDRMNSAFERYAGKAANDPRMLMPLAMDKFKQSLYDVGSKIGGVYDRDAGRIAQAAYNGVKDEIIAHDPTYATTMANYEDAMGTIQQLEGTFGLKSGRGKDVNIDTASRRLLSSMRNNANTNYGQRGTMLERIAEMDPTHTLMPTLAGQMASSWTPRGLQGLTPSLLGGAAILKGASPWSLLAAPLGLPRAVGELGYGLGRAAGTGAKIVDKAAAVPGVADIISGMGGAGKSVFGGMGKLQKAYPASVLAGLDLPSRLDDVRSQLYDQQPDLSPFTIPDDVQNHAAGGPVQYAPALSGLVRRYGVGGPFGNLAARYAGYA